MRGRKAISRQSDCHWRHFAVLGGAATLGINDEQVLMMAVDDVNAAGGVNGRPLQLQVRDSNSGSDRGYEQAKQLIYDVGIKILIGPENNRLSKLLVPDVKAKNITHIMPAVTAPTISEIGSRGTWIRLAPTPRAIGCAMALKALKDGHKSVISISAADDYQPLLVTSFNTIFSEYGGISKGAFNVRSGLANYSSYLKIIEDEDADVNLMMVYPLTGVPLAGEWTMAGDRGEWYLSPTLFTEMFLRNMPFGALEGFTIFSPSRSLTSECEVPFDPDTSTAATDTSSDSAVMSSDSGDTLSDSMDTLSDSGDTLSDSMDTSSDSMDTSSDSADTSSDSAVDTDTTSPIRVFSPNDYVAADCTQNNYERFSRAFAVLWGSEHPLPSSLFYYDGVILTALALALAAHEGNPDPQPSQLREYIRTIAQPPGRVFMWTQLREALAAIANGEDIAYSGVAADYEFPLIDGAVSGEARHRFIDTWIVKNNRFILLETISANCTVGGEV